MDLKSKHSYQTQSFLWLLGFSWLLIVCFVGFQYHREKELRTELLDSQLQIINAQLEEALSNARTPHDFFDAHSDFFEGLRITLIDLDGTVVYDSEEPPAEMSNHLDRPEVAAALTDGHGYDDVFVYTPIRAVAELGNRLLAFDGCLNFFSGPTDKNFSAEINLYDCHYTSTHIMGTTGGNNDDLIEANTLAAKGIIDPAVMVTHVGGIDSIAETTLNLPNIPGGKKLAYTQFDMPMTAIEDFAKLGEKDPFFLELDKCCKAHKGLWNGEAEKMILKHFNVEI